MFMGVRRTFLTGTGSPRGSWAAAGASLPERSRAVGGGRAAAAARPYVVDHRMCRRRAGPDVRGTRAFRPCRSLRRVPDRAERGVVRVRGTRAAEVAQAR